MKYERDKSKLVKPNLIPILDAVFIFIFFLLMSAQFLKVREIGSDAPAVKMISSDDPKKDQLNLILDINEKSISIKTGLPEKEYQLINLGTADFNQQINLTLIDLKKKFPEERNVIVRPGKKVKYYQIVSVLDSVRTVNEQVSDFELNNQLFDRVVFQTK